MLWPREEIGRGREKKEKKEKKKGKEKIICEKRKIEKNEMNYLFYKL
jgi:hypothetical protein